MMRRNCASALSSLTGRHSDNSAWPNSHASKVSRSIPAATGMAATRVSDRCRSSAAASRRTIRGWSVPLAIMTEVTRSLQITCPEPACRKYSTISGSSTPTIVPESSKTGMPLACVSTGGTLTPSITRHSRKRLSDAISSLRRPATRHRWSAGDLVGLKRPRCIPPAAACGRCARGAGRRERPGRRLRFGRGRARLVLLDRHDQPLGLVRGQRVELAVEAFPKVVVDREGGRDVPTQVVRAHQEPTGHLVGGLHSQQQARDAGAGRIGGLALGQRRDQVLERLLVEALALRPESM